MKNQRTYLIITGVLLCVLVLFEMFGPKPMDWTPSYQSHDKRPMGSYMLYQVLPDLFPGKTVTKGGESLYQELKGDPVVYDNLIVVGLDFSPAEPDLNRVLAFVHRGNCAFIAASRFGPNFQDTLQFSLGLELPFMRIIEAGDSVVEQFVHPGLQKDSGYLFTKATTHHNFGGFDTAQTAVLGTDGRGGANFLRVAFGQGYFYLHAKPSVFGNYHMKDPERSQYVSTALSYLPVGNVLWDEYYKPGRIAEHHSPLRYVLSSAPLKAAYRLLLLAALLFLVFEGQRRQRIIPVIKPLVNTSLEYIETVGQVYYRKKDHRDLALKKYRFFKEYLRSHYYFTAQEIVKANLPTLAQKTGVQQQTIEKVFGLYQFILKSKQLDDDGLESFYRAVEQFYKECK